MNVQLTKNINAQIHGYLASSIYRAAHLKNDQNLSSHATFFIQSPSLVHEANEHTREQTCQHAHKNRLMQHHKLQL